MSTETAAPVPMVNVQIDGVWMQFPKGTRVIEACSQAQKFIPRYCYHPKLSSPGNCRMCLIEMGTPKMGPDRKPVIGADGKPEIAWIPRPQISCAQDVSEGMGIRTDSPMTQECRKGVMEFLLINHPLDCPICDQAGECRLQEFSVEYGQAESRFLDHKVKKPKNVELGPRVTLDSERCILCTRCIRFMREIDGDAQIGIVNRGYGSEISTFEEQGVHSLLSGNLMDVCPVGAITTRDYRFKSRPWDNPSAVDTICTLCEKGCNTTAWLRAKPEWAKGAQLVRFTPRTNLDVNGYWMCDIGRFEYHWIEGDARLTQPMVRSGSSLAVTNWDAAIAAASKALGAAAGAAAAPRFLLSAHASHEELYVAARLAQHVLGDAAQSGVHVTWTTSEKPQPADTKFTVPAVNAPNVTGARLLGLTSAGPGQAADLSALRADVEGGRVSTLFVLDPGPAGTLGDVSWVIDARTSGKLATLIVEGALFTPLAQAADVVLPGACWVEKDACYTNAQGRLQAASRVIPPPGEALEDTALLLRLAKACGAGLTFTSAADVRADIAAAIGAEPGLAGIDSVSFARPSSARHWLQASNPMERLKWDHMFHDLPPVKFADMLERRPAGKVIPLVETK
jgi:NADH-quinone oxidoreductase subunit G